jgi:hypothetical protein
MYPETDELSQVVSDTVTVLFKRRLVDRVLRVWEQMAQGSEFPRRDQIEPAMLGEDWANCLVIAVRSPVQLSHFVAVGSNLLDPDNTFAGIFLSHLPQVLGAALLIDGGPRPASRYRRSIPERPVSAIRGRRHNRSRAGCGELPSAARK